MPDISKITFPSGSTYNIKDAVARELIGQGVSFNIAWGGTTAPTPSQIPAGVVITYDGVDYTGTLAAEDAQPGSIYLIKSQSQVGGLDVYDEYVPVGATGSKFWEKLGDTQLDLGNLGDLAYLSTVTLNKGDGDVVLGEGTSFTNSSSAVTFTGGATSKCLGTNATFTTTVTPATTNIKAVASGTALSTNNDTFVKSYPGTTSKLVTTSIPNVTANSAATLNFAMGTGDDAETLIISGTGFSGNTYTASNTTLGTAITAATGGVAANGSGDSVLTGLGTASTGNALVSASVGTQPTISIETGAAAGAGVVTVATGITSAITSTNDKSEVTAVTSVGTATAEPQVITVGTGDKVTVAKYNDLSVSVS